MIKIFNVAELNGFIKYQLESNIILKSFVVTGEVSGVTQQKVTNNVSGRRTWFTLTGSGAEISCVSWEGCDISQGDAVEIKGKIEVWSNKGQYRLNALAVKHLGEGAEKEALMKLAAELEKKGYFDPRNKKPIPPIIRHVALVTSVGGAAIGDVLETLGTRESLTRVEVYDVRVQGTSAAEDIAATLDMINAKEEEADVILLTRGGGGTADLAVFNDPLCFEAVHNSRIPVICAIGHERDESLSEKCADLQCITPTKAATVIADRSSRTMYYTNALSEWIKISEKIQIGLLNFERSLLGIKMVSPSDRLKNQEIRLTELKSAMIKNIEHLIQNKSVSLENIGLRVESSSPFAILEKGYGVIYKEGKVTDIASTRTGDRIQILMKAGSITAKVEEVRNEDIRTKI